MDTSGARRIVDSLAGKKVGAWQVLEYVGNGKSAVVFKATNGTQVAALKVFDPDLVARSGEAAQLERIGREISLRGKEHPNLVRILDGGKCPTTGYLYVVMEYIDAPNLASVVEEFPREQIRPVISQVASAARFLEGLDIVHRDIKTDNIAISSTFGDATLLDLGVIRPLDLTDRSPSSDGERKSFVGTLRYSPPEFAFRNEEHTQEGWRAVTFYQLGGVLHDLIMRKRLFEASSDPYTRLVEAVRAEVPVIDATDVSQDLVLLARNCLLKDPKLRLRYVEWKDFEIQATAVAEAAAARDRLRRRFAQTQEAEGPQEREAEQLQREKQRSIQIIQSRLRTLLVADCVGKEFLPQVSSYEFLLGDAGYLVLCFDPTPTLQLDHGLTIWFSVTIVDPASGAVEIRYRARVGETVPQSDLATHAEAMAFAGAFQEQVVQKTLMDMVYRLLDAAMQGAEAGVGWLTLVG